MLNGHAEHSGGRGGVRQDQGRYEVGGQEGVVLDGHVEHGGGRRPITAVVEALYTLLVQLLPEEALNRFQLKAIHYFTRLLHYSSSSKKIWVRAKVRTRIAP